MPRAIAASSPPPVTTQLALLALDDRGAGVLARRAARRRPRCSRSSAARARRSDRWATPRDRRGSLRSCARWPGRSRCAMSRIAVCVSSVSASGSTCRNAPAAGLERRDVVGGEQAVRRVVGAERKQLLVGELGASHASDGTSVPSHGEAYRSRRWNRSRRDRVPRRARLDGRGAGAGRRALGRADPAGGRELPDLGPADRRPRSIRALALIKGEAARVNAGSSEVPQSTAGSRTRSSPAADEVAGGAYDDQFPIDVFQTGSGTSSNMNMNEVIARLASAQLGRGRLGAPERPRERVAVVERRVPVGGAPRGRAGDHRRAAPRARAAGATRCARSSASSRTS